MTQKTDHIYIDNPELKIGFDPDQKILIGHTAPKYGIDIKTFHRGWHAMDISYGTKPKGFAEWVNMLWGIDVWYFRYVPLFKTGIFINLLILMVILFAR